MTKFTIADAEDATNAGFAMFDEFVEEFEAEWGAPLLVTMASLLIDKLPPQVIDALEQLAPDAVKTLRERQGGK